MVKIPCNSLGWNGFSFTSAESLVEGFGLINNATVDTAVIPHSMLFKVCKYFVVLASSVLCCKDRLKYVNKPNKKSC